MTEWPYRELRLEIHLRKMISIIEKHAPKLSINEQVHLEMAREFLAEEGRTDD